MSTTTIIFHAESKAVPPLILECEYTAWEGEPMVMYDRDGAGYPGSPPGVEVSEVRCVALDDDGFPAVADLGYQKILGALCQQADPKQIDRLVMEAANEDAQGDPDRNRE